ncbi:MAG TPA: hypothetical protein VGG03_22385 [Thermoanaerobaculia bacterium]|jgi:hypothetical protein
MTATLAEDRRLRRLFFALTLLYVLPFWAVRYVPTTDGPCHTYNAWVLRQHGNVREYPLFQQYYEINAKPYPNWIGQGTMALLMFALEPRTAEKLLVSGYVLLLLAGAWYLAGAVRPAERWLAFLAFPFAYNQLFQFGFYNFAISLALFLFIVGLWWRHRARPGLAFAAAINLLLWLCYFSHILSFALALIAIAVLWLATLRRESWRRHLLHILLLLPQVALPAWFFAIQRGGEVPSAWPFGQLLRFFARLEVLFTFGEFQVWLGIALAILFLLLLLLTLWRRTRQRPLFREEDAFLLLALLFTAFYFFSPDGMAGGYLLKQRLSLYPFLLLIPWLSPRLEGRAKGSGAAALALLALLNLGYLLHGYRVRGEEMARYVSGLDLVQPNTRLLALLFQHSWPTDFLAHAAGYTALEKGLIDWDNYEAKTSFFPTRFRDSAAFPDIPGILTDPGSLRVKLNRDRIDAVYTWGMPPDQPLARRLGKHYELTSWTGEGALYEKRRGL